MKNKTIIISLATVMILAFGLLAGVYLVRQNQDFREKAAPASTVYITPTTQNKNTGDVFTVLVKIDTGVNLITGIDLRINFDKDALEIISIEKASDISNLDSPIANNIDNNTGKISYAVYTVDKTKAVSGSGLNVLTISGKVRGGATQGTKNIGFENSTSASGINEGTNIITGMTGSSIVVSSQAQISATPTPTATSTATPSTNLTHTGTTTPTPTATGSTSSTKTTTPTVKPTQTITSSSGVVTSPISTATAFPIPITGLDWPTALTVGLGMVTIVTSFFLVF